MSSIASNLEEIQNSIPEQCTLVAVSKTKPSSDILEAYETGQRDFGENKVQELTQKAEELPKDIKWHMIGHLQRNKVKYIAPFVNLIHGVDSVRLLKEINKQAQKANRKIKCLLQIHIAEEESKFGFSRDELNEFLASGELESLAFVDIVGVMGMATNTQDQGQVKKEFKGLNDLFEELKNSNNEHLNMSIISMGMSGDYQLAIEQGSNMVRIGSSIFGARNYH